MLLKNKRIGITRAHAQANHFAQLVSRNGGIPVISPLIAFNKIRFSEEATERMKDELAKAQWVIFTSANTVKYLLSYSVKSLLKNKIIVAVGKKTQALLKKEGLSVKHVPSRYTGDALVKDLILGVSGPSSVFYPCGSLADHKLHQKMEEANIDVYKWVLYETVPDIEYIERLQNRLDKQELDILTFFSPSAIRFFNQYIMWDRDTLPAIACIGEVTALQAASLDLPVQIVPETYTAEDLIEAIGYYLGR